MNPSADTAVADARRRCAALRHRILHTLPKLPPPCRATLLRLLDAELRFLSRLPVPHPHPLSLNLGHLESLVNVIHHPDVLNVSRLSRPVPTTDAHVDLVCTFRRTPAWLLLSDRNPPHLTWLHARARVKHLLAAATSVSVAIRPSSLLLVFARGLVSDIADKLVGELGGVEIDFADGCRLFDEMEDGWVGVGVGAVFGRARVFEIRLGEECREGGGVRGLVGESEAVGVRGEGFAGILEAMRGKDAEGVDVVNFDTTALVAIVTGISNGGTEQLVGASEEEMRRRFKGNCEIVRAQVTSEREHPIIAELVAVVAGKKGIICESVCSELRELVSICGGTDEKRRAAELVEHLLVVPDSPSARVMDLPTTRKIALKNKIVFGTGDFWHAPTITANMGFVRAISQTGMSLLVVEHRPRSLIGD